MEVGRLRPRRLPMRLRRAPTSICTGTRSQQQRVNRGSGRSFSTTRKLGQRGWHGQQDPRGRRPDSTRSSPAHHDGDTNCHHYPEVKMFMGSARSESMGETHMFRKLVGLAAAGVVAAGVGTAVPASAAQASMQLSPATTTVAKGGDVALTVKVDTGGQAVNAIQFYINLPSRLHCSSITPVTTGWPNSFAPPNSCTDTLAAFVVYSNGGTSFN